MNRWIAAGAGALVLLGAVSLATAHASTVTKTTTQPANPQARPVANATALDSAVESKFTPVTPCRIADTRHGGGIIASGATRAFQVTGTSRFPAQGGTSGGCGIPASATAVSVSMTAIGESDVGYVAVFTDGATAPMTRSLSFTNNVAITASTDAALGSSGKIDAFVGGSGKTHLILDVTGYYISPMWVEVSSTGTYVKGSRVVSLTHIGIGSYQVDFDRDVSNCAYTATSYFYGTAMEVEPRSGDIDAVFVGAADYNGTGVDTYFYLIVTC